VGWLAGASSIIVHHCTVCYSKNEGCDVSVSDRRVAFAFTANDEDMNDRGGFEGLSEKMIVFFCCSYCFSCYCQLPALWGLDFIERSQDVMIVYDWSWLNGRFEAHVRVVHLLLKYFYDA